jgi:hypothetical protein
MSLHGRIVGMINQQSIYYGPWSHGRCILTCDAHNYMFSHVKPELLAFVQYLDIPIDSVY